MIKKTLTVAAIATMTSAVALPTAVKASCGPAAAAKPGVAAAACNPCAAKKPRSKGNACNPCAAASPCGAGTTGNLANREIKDVNTGYFDKVAINGYDPVAYFTMGKPVKGSAEHTHEWLGAIWQFANEEHRQAFAETPTKYAPQYGGYCAIGVAFDILVPNIDPNAWVIEDGKLYLQYSMSAHEDFSSDPDAFIETADENWREAKSKED